MIGRASDFYGPGVFTSAVGNEIFGRLASGKAPRVLGNPDQPHSFTFIEDFGRALVVLAAHGEAFGHTWHVPNAAPTSAREFAAKAAEAMGQPMKASRTPSGLIRILGAVNPMMAEVSEMLYQWKEPFVVDDTKFKKSFGYAFGAATSLVDGIHKTAQAYQNM